jgi:hypothetical protein
MKDGQTICRSSKSIAKNHETLFGASIPLNAGFGRRIDMILAAKNEELSCSEWKRPRTTITKYLQQQSKNIRMNKAVRSHLLALPINRTTLTRYVLLECTGLDLLDICLLSSCLKMSTLFLLFPPIFIIFCHICGIKRPNRQIYANIEIPLFDHIYLSSLILHKQHSTTPASFSFYITSSYHSITNYTYTLDARKLYIQRYSVKYDKSEFDIVIEMVGLFISFKVRGFI